MNKTIKIKCTLYRHGNCLKNGKLCYIKITPKEKALKKIMSYDTKKVYDVNRCFTLWNIFRKGLTKFLWLSNKIIIKIEGLYSFDNYE